MSIDFVLFTKNEFEYLAPDFILYAVFCCGNPGFSSYGFKAVIPINVFKLNPPLFILRSRFLYSRIAFLSEEKLCLTDHDIPFSNISNEMSISIALI